MRLKYLLLVLTSMCVFDCKRDTIFMPMGIKSRPSPEWFHSGFSFDFKGEKTMDYKVEIDASKSSPHLDFRKHVEIEKGPTKGFVRLESFGNKGVVKLEKYHNRVIRILINHESIKVDKEDSLVLKVYKNDKIIDLINISFIVGTKPLYGESLAHSGYLKKLCIDNWKNIGDFDGLSKFDFAIPFEYPKGRYHDNAEVLKKLKKSYDDCYIEDPDSDKY